MQNSRTKTRLKSTIESFPRPSPLSTCTHRLPRRILNAVSTATLSDVIILYGDEPLNSFDGELLLLMGMLEKKSIIIGGDERIKKLASSAGVKNALFVDSPHEIRFDDLAVDKKCGLHLYRQSFPGQGCRHSDAWICQDIHKST